jgi:PAS domain S-box-containing protein
MNLASSKCYTPSTSGQSQRLRDNRFVNDEISNMSMREQKDAFRFRDLNYVTHLYETILSTTDDFAYILDPQGRFLYANARLLKVWAKTLDQIIGKTCHELGYPTWHADMHMREIQEIVRTKQPIRGEVPFTGDSGISGIYDYIFKPVLDDSGNVEVIVGTTRDVTTRHNTHAQSEFLARLTQKLSTVSDSGELNRIATREIGQFLGAHRCYFFNAYPDIHHAHTWPDWCREDAASIEGVYTLAEYGAPEWWAAVRKGPVSVDDVQTDPRTKDFLPNYQVLKIAAYILSPFIQEGDWKACISVTSDVPRVWTADEKALLENAVARVWPLLERAQIEDSLRRSEEALSRIAAVVESSDDAIISKTLDGIIMSWNKGAERIFGYKAEEIVGKSILLLIPSNLQNEEPRIIERLKKGERIEHYETIRVTKGGRSVDISLTVSPVKDNRGKVIGASKIARDITEDKKRLEALRESEVRFRTMADAAPMLIWESGIDGLCNYFNQTWLDFVGRKSEQELGNGWREGLHPEDSARYLQLYSSSFDARIPFEMEYRLRHRLGEYRWILVKGTPRFGPKGTFQGYIGACVDITESVQARRTLADSRKELERLVGERTTSLQEAVNQMEEFSYSVSHDLRAPLRAMQGYATAVLEDYRGKVLDGEAEDYLQRIVTAGARMDRLTRDVLVYSKIPRTDLQLHVVTLDKLVSDIAQQFRQAKTRDVEISVETPLLPVLGNESFLAQAISNLVDNAVKFTLPSPIPRIRVWTEQTQGQVRLWVEDNGIGVKPEHQKRIWGMFERVHPQTKFEGTGIGLAIVRKTIERMNGTVGVISDGVTGSKFWIQLPGP